MSKSDKLIHSFSLVADELKKNLKDYESAWSSKPDELLEIKNTIAFLDRRIECYLLLIIITINIQKLKTN